MAFWGWTGQDTTGWMDASHTAVAFAQAKLSDENVTERERIWC